VLDVLTVDGIACDAPVDGGLHVGANGLRLVAPTPEMVAELDHLPWDDAGEDVRAR